MSKRLLVVACLAVVCSGCRLNSLSIGYHDDGYGHHRSTHVVTRIHSGHICSSSCHDHYWDGGRVVVLSGHRHGPGCGHYWGGSRWVVGVKHVGKVHLKTHKKIRKLHKPKKIKVKIKRHH